MRKLELCTLRPVTSSNLKFQSRENKYKINKKTKRKGIKLEEIDDGKNEDIIEEILEQTWWVHYRGSQYWHYMVPDSENQIWNFSLEKKLNI